MFPGAVYYKELMREKANARAQQRKVSKASDAIKLGSVYKNRHKRQPRSMLQIRESLKQMMEAEVIGTYWVCYRTVEHFINVWYVYFLKFLTAGECVTCCFNQNEQGHYNIFSSTEMINFAEGLRLELWSYGWCVPISKHLKRYTYFYNFII